MAQSMSPTLPTVFQAGSTTTRSNSLASTASNNSGTSLRRRSRTRTRTLNSGRRGKSSAPSEADGDIADDRSLHGETPPVPMLYAAEPEELFLSSKSEAPAIPPRSPRRVKAEGSDRPSGLTVENLEKGVFHARARAYSHVHIRDVFSEASRGRQTKSDSGSLRGARAKFRGTSLPRHAFRTAISSDESSQPSPLTPNAPSNSAVHIVDADPERIRDSVISSTSSSLYPPSTSSGSRAESSILPHSLRGGDEESSFSPHIVTHSGKDSDFDVDDVSYRLRLLVNNSYFLPPAHSKPSPLSLAPPNIKQEQKFAKPTTPAFLGFLGFGKSKSKPASPAQMSPTLDHPAPVLRTTSDSTTASGHIPRPHAHSLPQTPMHAPFLPLSQNPTNRVVVLREKMDDLVTAAKQAERDMKTRGDGHRGQEPPRGNNYIDDVIDPTDAVDLPPPSESSLFAVQASALHGLGIHDSVGAAVLAERLPPSPGMWSMSTEEDSWRKALLHEAVSHSLHNSADVSFSSPSASPRPAVSNSPSFRDLHAERPSDGTPVSSTPKPKIGQRIIEPDRMNAQAEGFSGQVSPVTPMYPPMSPMSIGSPPLAETPHSPWRSIMDTPNRAETPAVTYPLAPPPRRQLGNPLYSLSQTDLLGSGVRESDISRTTDSSRLRRVFSSPRLSAMHETDVGIGGVLAMTPPPITLLQRVSPASSSSALRQTKTTIPSFSSRQTARSVTSESHYSDDDLSYATPSGDMDDEPAPRPSMSISLHTDDRPSLSEYSHPSPTASAFQDAVFGSCRTPSPLLRRSHASSLEQFAPQPISTQPLPSRSAAISPPPRVSSSLGPATLPPPPRSPAVKPVYRPSTSSGASHISGRSSHSSTPLPSMGLGAAELQAELDPSSPNYLPEPTTPPLPLAERRGRASVLSLRVPTESISPSIHSAPAPASPTAFFDRIQSHPNAMDDLETSDESDDDEGITDGKSIVSPVEEARVFMESRSRAISNTASTSSARPHFTRLGNHSTPQLTPSPSVGEDDHDLPPFDIAGRHKPIANIPERGTFFASRKKIGKAVANFPLPHINPDNLEQLSAESESRSAGPSRSSSKRRPTTAGATEEKVRTWQRESLQKFDGMLLQHMAAERDTIKRITTNISTSRS